MRHIRVAAIAIVALAIIVAFAVVRNRGHQLVLTTYLQDGQGLRNGAPVRMAGVDIGFVKTVRVRPKRKDGPVEVVMNITTPYDLSVPSDATVMLATEGVLGQTFADIDIRNASGPPVANHSVLKSKANPEKPEAVLEHLVEMIAQRPCNKDDKVAEPSSAPRTKPR